MKNNGSAFHDELATVIPQWIAALTGQDIPANYHALITVMTLIVAIYGVSAACQKVFPSKEVRALKKEYEEKLADAAKIAQISKQDLRRIVEDNARTKTKPLMAKARDALKRSYRRIMRFLLM